jgi:hypothetical protein
MRTMNVLHFRGVRVGLAVLIAVSMSFAALPAGACGCGIYLPLEGEASVSEEHVLIRWDGQNEDIVMTLGVLGSSREAAVIFPVPTRAAVKLADGKVFDELRELTKPVEKTVYQFFPMIGAGAPAPAGGVTVLERQTLGPFDVSTLAATDAGALGDWLSANGYNLSEEVVRALEPYIAQGWYYIAVRLSPGAGEGSLTGALDPLWITFPYDRIVYPMRPSALARSSLTVFMYVLAEHRVDKPVSFGYESVQYADWVEPAALENAPALQAFVPKKLFLTKIVETIHEPAAITDDYVFQFAGADEVYHAVHYNYVFSWAGIPLCLVLPGCLFVLLVGGVVLMVRLARKKSRQGAASA